MDAGARMGALRGRRQAPSDSGYADEPKTPNKIEYGNDYRSEFLQDYIEVLYLSIR
jgi:hypothetical protein